ncbi:DUF6344 domain-containing protein [Streptomyces sp. NPDC056061]|uniref:DUF6344 domain-containing protein n=1 Tax=Streptomyces sp. NPDC056061 TaxID=3345700 RepID=UPI0035D6B296
MSSSKAKNIWTAFVTAFFALLAALGFMSTPAAATEQSAMEPATTNQEQTAPATTTSATASAPSVRWTLPRDRALPPTMKQRIHAEAHGSSPATRHVPLNTAHASNAANTGGSAHTLHRAPAGDASLLPP